MLWSSVQVSNTIAFPCGLKTGIFRFQGPWNISHNTKEVRKLSRHIFSLVFYMLGRCTLKGCEKSHSRASLKMSEWFSINGSFGLVRIRLWRKRLINSDNEGFDSCYKMWLKHFDWLYHGLKRKRLLAPKSSNNVFKTRQENLSLPGWASLKCFNSKETKRLLLVKWATL